MTVDELTGPSTEQVARARADRIRAGIHQYLETLAEIALAWERRDWQVLGYPDWQAYVDGEFGADRLRLPAEHRHRAVAELRLSGMSQRAIGTVLGVDQATVQRDLARGDASASPAEVRGADGKTYPAARPIPPAADPPASTSPVAGPAPDDRVWIATARKGIAAHALRSALLTRCSRATRTGLTLTAGQATDRWQAVWCRVCWPAEETTRFAAGDTAHAGPDVETHDPRVSTEAGAERRDSAPARETAAGVVWTPADGAEVAPEAVDTGDAVAPDVDQAAPASAPPAASPAGGAEVTPAEQTRPAGAGPFGDLTTAQVARLRAVIGWARAGLAAHPRNAAGRGKPATLGMAFAAGEPTPPVHPQVANRGQVTHVEVSWAEGQVDVVYRSDRYQLDELDMYPVDVDQALDLLCAYGVLPARYSRQYAAGLRAGLRGGDAIDGEHTEETKDA